MIEQEGLRSGSSEAEIAEHLRCIEADAMELRVPSFEKLRSVAERLRRLALPEVRGVSANQGE